MKRWNSWGNENIGSIAGLAPSAITLLHGLPGESKPLKDATLADVINI
ncbi:MAG: hypothetical protein ACJAS1_007504 [Oleiphilaceae bacterium]|jgi:hypothetical protein